MWLRNYIPTTTGINTDTKRLTVAAQVMAWSIAGHGHGVGVGNSLPRRWELREPPLLLSRAKERMVTAGRGGKTVPEGCRGVTCWIIKIREYMKET